MSELDGGRPPQPADVTPEPTSFTLKASVLQSAQGPAVRIDIMTVTGRTVLFGLPDDIAHTFEMVLAVARAAKHSLIVPPGMLPGPNHPELD